MFANGSQNRPLAILGLQLSKLSVKKAGYFSDKTEFQKSSTVLGYTAHVCIIKFDISTFFTEHFEILSVCNITML